MSWRAYCMFCPCVRCGHGDETFAATARDEFNLPQAQPMFELSCARSRFGCYDRCGASLVASHVY